MNFWNDTETDNEHDIFLDFEHMAENLESLDTWVVSKQLFLTLNGTSGSY